MEEEKIPTNAAVERDDDGLATWQRRLVEERKELLYRTIKLK